MLPRNARFSEN